MQFYKPWKFGEDLSGRLWEISLTDIVKINKDETEAEHTAR